MGLSHLEPAYTDKAAPFIEEFGGKLGGLEYLRRTTSLKESILPVKIIKPGESVGADTFGFTSQIVRGSHPHDFQGLVDTLETKIIDLLKNPHIDRLIEELREDAKSALVMDYAQHENPAYNGNIVIGMQPLMNASTTGDNNYRRGSMVEHPNRPGEYFIEWVEEWKKGERDLTVGLYDDQGKNIQSLSQLSKAPNESAQLVEMYKRIRSSELVRDDVSFQMEFGDMGKSLKWIYQVRAFMRKSKADFAIDEDAPSSHARMVFGATPAKGLEFPVFFDGCEEADVPNEPIAVLATHHSDSRNLEFKPKMGAYLVGTGYGSSSIPNLEHSHFWKAQKADVTVFETGKAFGKLFLDGNPLTKESGLTGDRVRIICDGTRAIVEKVM